MRFKLFNKFCLILYWFIKIENLINVLFNGKIDLLCYYGVENKCVNIIMGIVILIKGYDVVICYVYWFIKI